MLILFGGADVADLTGRTLVDALATLATPAGQTWSPDRFYAAHDALRQRLARLPGAQLHRAPNSIADLMAVADLAVGSPGVTSWERCALGLTDHCHRGRRQSGRHGGIPRPSGCTLYLEGRATGRNGTRLL